ncbi:hypothetical protein BJX70DRAFT_374077 [Aspergillus crustosus]
MAASLLCLEDPRSWKLSKSMTLTRLTFTISLGLLQSMALSRLNDAGTQHVHTVLADNSLAKACAQDIFIYFLGAVASILGELGGVTALKMESGNFFVVNDELSNLFQLFHAADLGSKEDAYWCIVPILHTRSLLPEVKHSFNGRGGSQKLR